jgi:hypothetical protein
MVSAGEKQRLMEQYRNDPLASRAPVLESVAGIAAIALVTVIGIQADAGRTVYGPDYAEAAVIIARSSGSFAESQKRIEERRGRVHVAAPSHELDAAAMRTDVSAPLNRADAIDDVTLLRRSSD